MSTSDRPAASEEIVTLRFPHSKDEMRHIVVKDDDNEYHVYRLAPIIKNWPASLVPTEVNPRSHDEECLKSPIAKEIEETLRDDPEDFWLANRGGYLLAERVRFDSVKSTVELILTDREIHGMADGATTNAVIRKVQDEFAATGENDLGEALGAARFNLDVVVGLTDKERIAKLVRGRNRSVQVKSWSLADFEGKFDWLKEVIDRENGPFAGKVGWEENAGKAVTVMDVISIMTLFHPCYNNSAGRRRAPTVAYSSKGTADRRLCDDDLLAGFKALRPVLEDILSLYEHVYAGFEPTYEEYNRSYHNKRSKLARRRGVDNKPVTLPLTGIKSEYKIDRGLMYPLVNGFRALLDFKKNRADWIMPPKEFFKLVGLDLMAVLIEHFELARGNPQTVGKTSLAYSAVYYEACSRLAAHVDR